MILKRAWSRALSRALSKLGWAKIPSATGSGAGYAGFSGWSNLGSRQEQLRAYQNHVYKCVSVIYRRCMSVPWKLYKVRDGEKEVIKRHPFIDLMKKPNAHMSGRFLHALTQMHLDLTGTAFWLKVPNRLGRTAELWPLSPALFSSFIMNDARTDLLAYEFHTDTGAPVRYRPEEIVYFHYPHPLHWLEGASPVQAVAFAYDIDLASRVYQRNFFQNSARPDLVFESDQPINPDDARRLLLAWKADHQGVRKAWEPAILDNGLKAHILSANAKDMEFVGLANLTKEDILEAYGVPEAKLGTVADVNRANDINLEITFNSETIKPKLALYDETISRFILPEYGDDLRMEHDDPVPRDKEFELRRKETDLRMKFSTVNDERARMGLAPVKWGDKPFISIAEIQYGDLPGAALEPRSGALQRHRSTGFATEEATMRRDGHSAEVPIFSEEQGAQITNVFHALADQIRGMTLPININYTIPVTVKRKLPGPKTIHFNRDANGYIESADVFDGSREVESKQVVEIGPVPAIINPPKRGL